MKMDHYKYTYKGSDIYLSYFTNHPLKDWSYQNFSSHFSQHNEETLKSSYQYALNKISCNRRIPPEIKKHTQKLMKKLTENKEERNVINNYGYSSGSIIASQYINNIYESTADTTSLKPQKKKTEQALTSSHSQLLPLKENHEKSDQTINTNKRKQIDEHQEENASEQQRVKNKKNNFSTSLSSNSSVRNSRNANNNDINNDSSVDNIVDNNNDSFVDNILNNNNDDDNVHYDIAKNEGVSWDSLDYHRKRTCKYNFLSGGYEPNSTINVNYSWNVNHRNVSSLLMEYREKSKKGALHFQNLSDSRILSLSFVFLFCPPHKTSCLSRIENNFSTAVLNSIDIKKYWAPVFNNVWDWCIEIDRIYSSSSSTITNSTKNAKRTLMQLFLNSSDDHTTNNNEKEQSLEMISDILLSFINKFHHWIHYCTIESSFINQHLVPFLENIFEKDHRLKGKLGESFVMNGRNIDNGNASLMADYTVSYSPHAGITFDLLVIEVKPISKNSSSQPQSDLVKLGKEMKRMIDYLADASIENISVCGVLVEGVNCFTYEMDLEYDGIYRMIQLGQFNLVRDVADILLLPKAIEYLLQTKAIILETLNSIDKRYKNNDSIKPTTTITTKTIERHLWKRHACGSPVKVVEE